MADQVNGHPYDTVRSDQRHRLGLELRQLQDRDFQCIAHHSRVYRIAVYLLRRVLYNAAWAWMQGVFLTQDEPEGVEIPHAGS